MRPGEIIPGEGPVPAAAVRRRATIQIKNTGRFPVYVGSHFPLVLASAALEFPREGLEGARLDLPAGATARLDAGGEAELPIVWT